MNKEQIQHLIDEAEEARTHAYAPYSHFPVGAAVLCGSGRIYTGCNMENNSYGACLCAERNAIGTAVAAGEREMKALAVVGSHTDYTTPCGICRQVIREMQIPEIICAKNRDDFRAWTAEELLPHAFFEENLLHEK
jgi:cytidine deaminase